MSIHLSIPPCNTTIDNEIHPTEETDTVFIDDLSNSDISENMSTLHSVTSTDRMEEDETDLDDFFSMVETEPRTSSRSLLSSLKTRTSSIRLLPLWKNRMFVCSFVVLSIALGIGAGALLDHILTNGKQEEPNDNNPISSVDDVSITTTIYDESNNTSIGIAIQPAPSNLPILCGANQPENSLDECAEVCEMASCCWKSDSDDYCFYDNAQNCPGYNSCPGSIVRVVIHENSTSNIDDINNSNKSVLISDAGVPTATTAASNNNTKNSPAATNPLRAPFDLPILCKANQTENSLSKCAEACEMASCCWSSGSEYYCFHENVDVCQEYSPCLDGAMSMVIYEKNISDADGTNIDNNNSSNVTIPSI